MPTFQFIVTSSARDKIRSIPAKDVVDNKDTVVPGSRPDHVAFVRKTDKRVPAGVADERRRAPTAVGGLNVCSHPVIFASRSVVGATVEADPDRSTVV